ncbi:hypothetical protein CONCODRAFT_13233 [Conidiobolus coronatus NRRL 28638]|uniref:C2H2-type domain-containing protein n=1 Tax=Conidiobolus coronatus (strain ATCC 28846 / CBS 209.66 / NRRL 28638) TaxID=796925 RepID=A0A137NR94_CONC2|nr:hypothetical protein CONCODRAFT_13233 [Conidiobolus coronatus NRRL 28638]|eukprot:KXN65248.1 hypothetical protein CONCODRAFT_13233 [Conidiobolus coronatus NRRL 28638]
MLVNGFTQRSNFEESKFKLGPFHPISLPSISNLPLPNLSQIKLAPIKKSQENLELKFKCKKCTKSFKRKNSLIRHERVHTGIKPFCCKVCNKKFTRKDILESHKLSMKCRRRTQTLLKGTSSEISNNTIENSNMINSALEGSRRTSIASLIWSNESDDFDLNSDYYLPFWSSSLTKSYSSQSLN